MPATTNYPKLLDLDRLTASIDTEGINIVDLGSAKVLYTRVISVNGGDTLSSVVDDIANKCVELKKSNHDPFPILYKADLQLVRHEGGDLMSVISQDSRVNRHSFEMVSSAIVGTTVHPRKESNSIKFVALHKVKIVSDDTKYSEVVFNSCTITNSKFVTSKGESYYNTLSCYINNTLFSAGVLKGSSFYEKCEFKKIKFGKNFKDSTFLNCNINMDANAFLESCVVNNCKITMGGRKNKRSVSSVKLTNCELTNIEVTCNPTRLFSIKDSSNLDGLVINNFQPYTRILGDDIKNVVIKNFSDGTYKLKLSSKIPIIAISDKEHNPVENLTLPSEFPVQWVDFFRDVFTDSAWVETVYPHIKESGTPEVMEMVVPMVMHRGGLSEDRARSMKLKDMKEYMKFSARLRMIERAFRGKFSTEGGAK